MPAELTPDDVSERLDDDAFTLVDIRDARSYADGHVPGAEHLTTRELQQVVRERDWTDTVAFMCYVGKSSKQAAAFVEQYGDTDDVYSVAGGIDAWNGPLVADE
ncbi:MAG: rhodanese-like domain-containing protein [Halarchaeum sp.]